MSHQKLLIKSCIRLSEINRKIKQLYKDPEWLTKPEYDDLVAEQLVLESFIEEIKAMKEDINC